MDSKLYNVVFQGEIAEGYPLEHVKRNLSSMFKLNTKQIQEMFAGKPLVVKERVDYQTALKYKTAFEKTGTVCHIVPAEKPRARVSETPPQKKPTQSSQQFYNVIFHGEIAEGQNIEQVKRRLCALFKTDMNRINQLFINKAVMIQGNVPHQTAVKFQKTFTQAGAICHIEPVQKGSKTAKERQEQAGKVSPPKPTHEPAGSSELESIVASYGTQIRHKNVIFIAPNIPEERVDMAARSYAYAYRKQREQALVLMDIRDSGERLLLSDKKLYLKTKQTRPKSFKLTNIQSLSFQGDEVSINEQVVFSVSSEIVDDMKSLVELIQKVTTYITETTPQEQPKKVEETPPEAPSPLIPLIKKAIVPVVVIVLIAIVFNYVRQSRRPKPESGTVTEVTTEEGAQEESVTGDVSTTSSQAGETTSGIKDEGTRCQTHKYILPAGSSENLRFSRGYPLEEQETTTYEADPNTDSLTKYGFYVAPPVVWYETSTISYQVWAFDGRQMFDAVRSDPSYDKNREWGEGGGVPYNIPIRHSESGMTIHWRKDGYAIIEKLDGMSDKAQIGKLTQEELTAKLNPEGFQPMLKYTIESMGKTFELYAIQIQDEKTVKIQIYDVSVTVPDSIEQKTDLGSVSFKPTEGWKERLSVNVKGSWGRGSDPNKMHAVIIGPAETADCFQ